VAEVIKGERGEVNLGEDSWEMNNKVHLLSYGFKLKVGRGRHRVAEEKRIVKGDGRIFGGKNKCETE